MSGPSLIHLLHSLSSAVAWAIYGGYFSDERGCCGDFPAVLGLLKPNGDLNDRSRFIVIIKASNTVEIISRVLQVLILSTEKYLLLN